MSAWMRFDYKPHIKDNDSRSQLSETDKKYQKLQTELKAKRKANRKKKKKSTKQQKLKQQQQKINAQKKGEEICMCGSMMMLKQVRCCKNARKIKVCDDCNKPLTRDMNVWECKRWFDDHPILCVECKIKRNEYEQILLIAESESISSKPKKAKSVTKRKQVDKDKKDKICKINSDTKDKNESMEQELNESMEQELNELNELQQELQAKTVQNELQLKQIITQYECKPIINDEEHTASMQSYADIATKHANILNEWKRTTFLLRDTAEAVQQKHITEIKANDDDDEKVSLSFSGKLYQQYMRCSASMDQQAKRLKQSTSSQYLLELITKQNRVSEQVVISKAKDSFNDNDYQQCNSQYESVKTQRTELEQVIHDIIKQYDALVDKENELFQQMTQKKQIKEIVDQQMEDLNLSSIRFVSLIDGYNEFINDTKKYTQQLTDYFNKEWQLFESKWYHWNADDIMVWFKYKTRKLNTHRVHWEKIATELHKRGISGQSVAKFNDNTLDLIGLQDFDISTFVMSKIIELRNKYKYEEDGNIAVESNSATDDNKSIPSKYLCPINKQIMRDPVIAFDGRTYEKEAIETYLKLHKKSPITNATAYTINTFPNMQLQEEIHAFLQLNQQATMQEGSNHMFQSQKEGAETAYI